ncbi:DALR anticodon binding domain containing 3 [Caligus rogercresseyi]|uniref:DALR anticodon binding domain containing 3 n=1 Tax=Caligus rogercresseyi TaxID=217165 RepID=A0A7T8GRY8_CALRO|nr:DALR anticodon binding domain containing 3 [Caligus rogercresseyi]
MNKNVGALEVHSSNSAPLTQARVRLAQDVLERLGASSLSIHVEPVMDSRKRVYEGTMEESWVPYARPMRGM